MRNFRHFLPRPQSQSGHCPSGNCIIRQPQPHPPRPPQPHPPRPPQPHPPRPPPLPPPQPHPPRPPQPHPPRPPIVTDQGPRPFATDIRRATLNNQNYRTTLWTGANLQLTLMTIPPGGDIGLEIHPDNDQYFYIEEGQGLVQMGDSRERLNFRQVVMQNFGVFIPARTWHNITNLGTTPLRVFSIYAPPHHAHGTVHATKAIADQDEHYH